MSPPHVTVCICTFRRPELLDALLTALSKQKTERRLTFSVRVVDNDPGQSARSVVAKWAASGCFPVEACSELRQNIARARNRAVADINCDYVAMIDDDEVPCDDWLLRLVGLIESSGADGVLGPVYPAYPPDCPPWLERSGLCDRPTHTTGQALQYYQTRTGNVLLRRAVFDGEAEPFKIEFGLGGGEDVDFFKRKLERGCRFLWCNEAEAFETVSPDRWVLGYYFRRQLRLGGLLGERTKTFAQLLQSLSAGMVHAAQTLVLFPAGRKRYSRPLVRFAYHLGYVAGFCGLSWRREREEMTGVAPQPPSEVKCQSSTT